MKNTDNSRELGTLLSRGLSWQAKSLIAQSFLNIIFLAVLARLAAPEAFGILALLRAVLAVVEIFSELGFGSALIRMKKVSNGHIWASFCLSTMAALVVYLCIYVLSPILVIFFEHAITESMLQVFALALIFKAMVGPSRSLLFRALKIRPIFISTIISTVVGNVIVAIPLAFYGYGVWALILGFVVTNVIALVVLLLYEKLPYFSMPLKIEILEILNFGTKLTLYRAVSQAMLQIDKVFLAKFFSVANVGAYERAQYTTGLPNNIVASATGSVFFSTLSRLRDRAHSMYKFFWFSLSAMWLMVYFLDQPMLFAPELVIEILLGSQWLEHKEIFRGMAVLVLMHAMVRFSDPLIKATDLLKHATLIKLVIFVMLVISLFLLGRQLEVVEIIYMMAIFSFVQVISIFSLILIKDRSSLKGFRRFFLTLIGALVYFLFKKYMLFKFSCEIDYLFLIFLVFFETVFFCMLLVFQASMYYPEKYQIVKNRIIKKII